ncbi:glycosyltransferase family 4 protein [Thioclava sp.]|uniref:glycosyltransferase family 4 protein n=1 Tax=Thioclava sp. TaxID=1933450 RepID=UPI003AA9C635
MQYEPYLSAVGVDLTILPFFDDDYLRNIYAGVGKGGGPARAFVQRYKAVRQFRDTDVIWLEKEAFPWLPWMIEHVLLPSDVPIVSDYDDAIFHNYDLHRLGLVRRFLGRKIDKVMAGSSLVTAGNAYLAQRARDAGAAKVEIIPTVVDADVYTLREKYVDVADRVQIGWIGTPSTWAAYMEPMMPMLQSVAVKTGARLRVVGAGAAASPNSILDNVAWSEGAEVSEIQKMDIGLMPLTDTPWARGKCGYKLIQYMACGLPVIASPVGVNSEIVEHGVNGFLATSEAEWREALITLLADPDLRARMGAKGRRKVEEQYSLQVWGPRVAALLTEVAQRGKLGTVC